MFVNEKKLISLKFCKREAIRYIANGLFATLIHYIALTANIEILKIQSAGLANTLAAAIGITVSFIGSRIFVFQKQTNNIYTQATKFIALYASFALMHGIILFAWTDIGNFDYRSGFIFATALQMTLSYIGNKFLVLK